MSLVCINDNFLTLKRAISSRRGGSNIRKTDRMLGSDSLNNGILQTKKRRQLEDRADDLLSQLKEKDEIIKKCKQKENDLYNEIKKLKDDIEENKQIYLRKIDEK